MRDTGITIVAVILFGLVCFISIWRINEARDEGYRKGYTDAIRQVYREIYQPEETQCQIPQA